MAENSGTGGGIAAIISSVSHALTTLDPKAGASAIEQVLGALKGAPGTEAITGTLTSLHGQLAGGSPNGSQIGTLLTQLGQQTRTIGAGAGPLGAPLTQLAERLTSAGTQVSGAGAAA